MAARIKSSRRTDQLSAIDLVPMALLTGATDVFSDSIWLHELILINDTNGAITVQAQDSNLIAILPSGSLAAGGTMSLTSFYGRYCPGKVTITCSADGIIVSAVARIVT